MTTRKIDQTYYVTKYGLTEGILVVKPGHGDIDEDGRYLYMGELGHMPIQVKATDFFASLDEAKDRVDALRRAKLKTIDRQKRALETYQPAVKDFTR